MTVALLVLTVRNKKVAEGREERHSAELVAKDRDLFKKRKKDPKSFFETTTLATRPARGTRNL